MDNFPSDRSRDALPIGYLLHWYELLEVIGRGGYGITYLAMDRNLQRKVAIKEYLPLDFACRNANDTVNPVTANHNELFNWGLQRFLVEARTLAKFNHSAIIRVVSVFEFNNTAYMVMEYEEGDDLAITHKQRAPFTEQELLDLFVPIIEGLAMVHDSGFIHRDIKPSNIYIRSDGTSVLLDFGSARQTIGSRTRALTSLVTAGYAPFEQYNESEDAQGAWTDIYGLGATLYFCMTGTKPTDAMERGSALLKLKRDIYRPLSKIDELPYSQSLKLAVDHALMFHSEDRPQSARQWADMVTGKVEVPQLPMSEEETNASNFHQETTTPATTSSQPAAVQNYSGRPDTQQQTELNTATDTDVETTNDELDFDDSTRVYQRPVRPPSGKSHGIQGPSAESVEKLADRELLQQAVMGSGTGSKAPSNAFKERMQALQAEIGKKAKIVLEYINNNQRTVAIGTAATVVVMVSTIMVITIVSGSDNSLKSDEPSETISQVQKSPPVESNTTLAGSDPKTKIEEAKAKLIDGLLTQAKLDVANNRIIQPKDNNAVDRYKKVLSLQSDQADALEGLSVIIKRYENLINATIDEESWDTAKAKIEELKTITDDKNIIEPLQARLADYEKHLQLIAKTINRADSYLSQNKLTVPKNNNALDLYTKVLELDPQNPRALEGVNTIIGKLSDTMLRHLQSNQYSKAQYLYDKIEAIDPEASALKEAESKLAAVIERRRSIGRLLKSAENDFIRGNLTTPRGSNAYTKYREVLTLSPRNKNAIEGIDRIYGYYVSSFYQYVNEGRFKKANTILSTLNNVNYGKKQVNVLKRILSEEKVAAKNEPETIKLMLSQLEKGLKNKNLNLVSNLSTFKNKNQSFLQKLFDKYSTYSVKIMQTDHDLKSHKAKAKIQFTDMVTGEEYDSNKDKINIDIQVSRDDDREWKIVW